MLGINDLARKMKEADPTTKIGENKKAIKLLLQVITDSLLIDGEDIKLGKVLKIYFHEYPKMNLYDGINKEYHETPSHKVVKIKKLSKLQELDKILKINHK